MVKVRGNQLVKYEPKEFYDSYYNHPSIPLFPNSPIWVSKPEPVAPDDCERWEGSLLCSAFITNASRLDLGIEFINDACNIGIQSSPNFGFISFPSSRIVYRKPECRNPLPQRNTKIFREASTSPSEIINFTGLGGNINQGAWVEFQSYQELYSDYQFFPFSPFIDNEGKITIPYQHVSFQLQVLEARFPHKLTPDSNTFGVYLKVKIIVSDLAKNTKNEGISIIYVDDDNPSKNIFPGRWRNFDNRPYVGIVEYTTELNSIGIYLRVYTRFSTLGRIERFQSFVEKIYAPTRRSRNDDIYNNYEGDMVYETSKREIKISKEINTTNNSFTNLVSDSYYYREVETKLLYIKGSGIPSFGIPYPMEDCCKGMGCCPTKDTEQLLRLILKRIGEPKTVEIFDENLERKGSQKANKTPPSLNDYLKLLTERVEIANRIMGIANFPVEMPDTMIRPHKEGIFGKIFGFIDEKKRRKITSITELIAWMAEQDSAVLGQFHQVFEIENLDGGKDTVVIPNIAEGLAEILLLISQMARQTSATFEAEFRLASEIMATRVAATKAATIAADIQDFLDYPTNTKTEKVPTAFNIPKLRRDAKGDLIADKDTEDYRKVLENGEVQFTYDDWNGEKSFHDQMLDLLQVAAMLRAILYQKSNS